MLLFYFILLPLAASLECYNFVDRQIGGRILYGDKQIVQCSNPTFCLSIYDEGNNENVYTASCANNSNSHMTCENVTCTKSHANEISTKKCCCNTDLCNLASKRFSFTILALSLLAYMLS
ncbi:hypothetical protein V3C99_015738 [Haemonchus contortus]